MLRKSIFSETLQLHCKFRYIHNISVCLSSSVTRVYCDKTAVARIMQFSQKFSPVPYSLPAKFDYENRTRSIDRGPTGDSNWVGWFSIKYATLYLGNGERQSLGDNN